VRDLKCDVCGVAVASEQAMDEIPEDCRPDGLKDMCLGCAGGLEEKDAMIRERQDGERARELHDWLAKKAGVAKPEEPVVVPDDGDGGEPDNGAEDPGDKDPEPKPDATGKPAKKKATKKKAAKKKAAKKS